MAVIDRFEMVDIGHQYGQRQGVAGAIGQFRRQAVEDAAAVGNLSQLVGARAFLECPAQLDDVEMIAGGRAFAAVDGNGHGGDHRRLGHAGRDQHAARLYKGMADQIGHHHAADAADANERHAQKGGRGRQHEGHADGDDHQAEIEKRRQRAFVKQE